MTERTSARFDRVSSVDGRERGTSRRAVAGSLVRCSAGAQGLAEGGEDARPLWGTAGGAVAAVVGGDVPEDLFHMLAAAAEGRSVAGRAGSSGAHTP